MDTVIETIKQYGGDPLAVVRFADDGPDLLPYATLVSAREAGVPGFSALHGVYEWQDRPLMLLVDGEQLRHDGGNFSRLRRAAAMRGDAPYLGVLDPGRLVVHQIGL